MATLLKSASQTKIIIIDFSDMEIHLVQQVANHCAIALRQAKLYQAAQPNPEERTPTPQSTQRRFSLHHHP